MHAMFRTVLATAGLACSWTAWGAEPPPEPLRLTECRIKVIDQVTLAADQAGVLGFLECREGDAVQARQRMAGVRDDVVAAQLAIARQKAEYVAEIEAKQKAHEIAINEHEQSLAANRAQASTVPRLEIERLKLAKELAAFEIVKAQHELKLNQLHLHLAEQELAQFAIAAPFSGVVTHVFKHKGEAVRPGDPVLELTSTERLRVEGWLELADSFSVAAGARVKVRLNIPDVDLPVEGRSFEGRVSFVDVVVEPVSQRVKVWADVVNQDQVLRAGLMADMTIERSPFPVAATPGGSVVRTGRTK
jgi:multidrug efflux pump subunit AcrA (membrane-fusion protein)